MPARPRSSVPSFLFLSFLLFMLNSHNGDEFLARHQHQDALRALTWQLSNYTAWLNGTESNFTILDRDPALAPILDEFGLQGLQLDPYRSSYYQNITGFIHGGSQFYNLTAPNLNESVPWATLTEQYLPGLNLTDVVERLGDWDWESSEKLALSVVEKRPLQMDETVLPDSDLSLVHGRIELTNKRTSENLRFEFEGVHFLSNGSIYGFAEPSGQRIDIRLLPALVPESVRNATASIIAPELNSRINKLKNIIDAGVLDVETSSDDLPKTNCSFTFFAHIHPVPVPEFLMNELEGEIQNPTGISTVSPPQMSITGLLLSKDCGIMYTLNDTESLRSRTFFRKVTTYAGLSALSYLIVLVLFSRQMDNSRNPSGISRVSRWTFLSQAIMDSVSFAGHITFAILAEGRPSMSLIAPAFLACILFVQEAQFCMLVNSIQVPETFTPPQPPPNPPPNLTPATAQAVPRPVTTPVNIRRSGSNLRTFSSLSNSDHETNAPSLPDASWPGSGQTLSGATPPDSSASPFPSLLRITPPAPPSQTTQAPPTTNTAGAATTIPSTTMSFFSFFIHHLRTDPQARQWIGLFIFLAVIVRVILSPMLSVIFVATTYSFIWLPQIMRSARRNRSSGLSKEYVIGTTLCRLFSAIYFLWCPKNVLDVEPRPWAPFLATFVILQATIVILQDIISPSFFLPEKFKAAKGYDYHPPMPPLDPEAPEQSLGDCAICMDSILLGPSLRAKSEKHDQGVVSSSNADTDLRGATTSRRTGFFGAMQSVGSSNARKSYSLAPCHHLFHTECLEKWLAIKNICPQCRRPLPPL
ncbi:hypothetical protein FA15DRAFT_674849 [Coprinopsis marcescibilis]|uniref:RING-type E3 ubiquitin transferase n=1 Tax=Coprinopsis marcescibilis TaxID=230819 RepID=A0A5C3KGY5_COPMA|nr:hypothetical protein FA15DRAFT_674849 [Coprinopsis marcescibilis]